MKTHYTQQEEGELESLWWRSLPKTKENISLFKQKEQEYKEYKEYLDILEYMTDKFFSLLEERYGVIVAIKIFDYIKKIKTQKNMNMVAITA